MAGIQSNLFGEIPSILERCSEMFDAWAVSTTGKAAKKALRADSEAVYRDMWSALTKWCIAERIHPAELSAADLASYLRSRDGRRGQGTDLEARYAWRLLRLVELVLQHWARSSKGVPSTSVAQLLQDRPEIRFANAADSEPAPEFLDAGEARTLVAFVTRPVQTSRAAGDWKGLRDRCAVALHLGAGLTPGEVRELLLSDVKGIKGGTRKIRVAANGTVRAHEAPVAGWAWRVLQAWLSARAALSVPGDILLPSTRATGGAWKKTGHYEAVKGVMAAVGLPESGGAYRLRHTFALRQLKRGRSATDVSAWMGIDEAAMGRYRNVVYGDVEVA